MSAKERLQVGIVGCGEVAQSQHIPCLLKIKDAEIAAVCDRNEDLPDNGGRLPRSGGKANDLES